MQLNCNFALVNPDKVHKEVANSVVPWLGKTMKHIHILVNSLIHDAGFDLTHKQLLLMNFINSGVNTQSELCMITERDKSSLTRLVQSLEKKGFVTRSAHEEDKRQQMVRLTPQGLEMLDKAMPIIGASFKIIEAGIEKEELEIAKNVLKKLLANTESELNHLQK